MRRAVSRKTLLLAICYHITLIALSIIPLSIIYPTSGPAADERMLNGADIPLHFIAYFTLTILWRQAFLNSWESASVAVFTGGVLEIVQSVIPWRSFSVLDFLSNVVGVATAISLAAIIKRRIASSLLPRA